jgi:hypothetical protein
MTAVLLKAASIITMDETNPRAEAIAFDDAREDSRGRLVLSAAAPRPRPDLGHVLMPGSSRLIAIRYQRDGYPVALAGLRRIRATRTSAMYKPCGRR